MFFFTKSIIAKQFEGSRIKCMCIFHVLTVRGLPGSEEASVPCMGLVGNAKAPLATRLVPTPIFKYIIIYIITGHNMDFFQQMQCMVYIRIGMNSIHAHSIQ